MNDGHSSGQRAALHQIVLADDHAVLLGGLHAVLAERPGIEIAAVATTGIDAIAAIKRHAPDLALLDDAMPGATGLEVIGEARRWSPGTRFAILTGGTSAARLAELVDLGVAGILLKSMPPEDILAGIEAMLAGETVLAAGAAEAISLAEAGQALTVRERQVLEGIARGLSNAAIGETLGLSAKTVDSHRTRLMKKMNAHNIAELLLTAVRHNLIGTP